MAINLYLAQKYDGPMHCASAEVLGLAAQWSFWAMLEIEQLLLHLLEHRVLLAEHARDLSVVERNELLAEEAAGDPQQLLGRTQPSGRRGFTVADLNVASILAWGKIVRLDLSAWPDLKRWLDGCLARPANARARAMGK